MSNTFKNLKRNCFQSQILFETIILNIEIEILKPNN